MGGNAQGKARLGAVVAMVIAGTTAREQAAREQVMAAVAAARTTDLHIS
jgi:hypothetical protein